MAGHGQDLALAFRMLPRQPGFTAIALLTLALSIGATTAIFSVVNGIVLRPLPYEESDRLVLVFENNLQRGWTTFAVAPANYADWARASRTFESMVALSPGSAALVSDQGAEQVPATFATAACSSAAMTCRRRHLSRSSATASGCAGSAAIAQSSAARSPSTIAPRRSSG
jgi:hypothetical protein